MSFACLKKIIITLAKKVYQNDNNKMHLFRKIVFPSLSTYSLHGILTSQYEKMNFYRSISILIFGEKKQNCFDNIYVFLGSTNQWTKQSTHQSGTSGRTQGIDNRHNQRIGAQIVGSCRLCVRRLVKPSNRLS